MKKYQINENHKGVVMVVQTIYKPGQMIVDDGKSPEITNCIAKLLKLDKSPISEVKADTAPAPKSDDSKSKGGK